MTLPVTIPNTFANATTSIPLANLDANFVTIYDTVNGIGNGAESLANVSITGGTVTNSAVSATTLNTSGQVVFNDAGADVDFRVEGDTNASLLFVDASADAVGIGTSTPQNKLHVVSSAVSGTTYNSDDKFIVEADGTCNINMISNTTGANFLLFSDTTRARGSVGYDHTSDYMRFSTAGSERMRIDFSGRLLLGATSFPALGTFNAYTNNPQPAGRFLGGSSLPDGSAVASFDKNSATNTTSQNFVIFSISAQTVGSGQINANGASQAAFGTFSDRRLKENIVDLEPQLANICALRPVEFDYIESEGGGHQISFIAQEFEEVYPDAVGERSDGMKTLTGWDKTTARLVKAIQELKAELDTVKAELAILKGQA